MQYPLTSEQREELIKRQGGRCLLCGVKPDALVIDHDHKTGEVRGALCSQCNVGLGMFKDSVPMMYAAIVYLEGYRGMEADMEGTLPRPPVSTCPGSWGQPVKIGPGLYRCGECDQSAGSGRQIKMELIRRGTYLMREHYRSGDEPRRRGPARRIMSAVEAIH